MAWNRGSEGATPVKAKAKPSPARGIVAGLVVVVLVVGAYFTFFSGSETRVETKTGKRQGQIKEVTPAVAPTNKVAEVKEKKIDNPLGIKGLTEKNRAVLEARAKKYGLGGPVARVIKVGEGDPDNPNHFKQPKPLFENDAENIIDAMLTMKVGDRCYGEFNFKDFDQVFKESLKNAIIPTQDDSEEVAARKRAVNEAKIELAEAMRNGESPLQRILETRKYMNEMATFRDQMVSEVMEQEGTGEMTEEQVEDLYAAANVMLKEKGLEPLISHKERKAIHQARMERIRAKRLNQGK